MKYLAVGLLCCQAVLPGQTQLSGIWESKFEGRVFLTIQLAGESPVTGSLSLGNITVNEQGVLVRGVPPEAEKGAAIRNVRREGDTLSFEIDDGDDGPLKLELHVVADGKGELRFLNSPSRINPLPIVRR